MCKGEYKVAHEVFLNWLNFNKPRSIPLYKEMNLRRKDFKDSLDLCNKNEQQIRDQQLFEYYKNTDKKRFWQKVSFRRRIKPARAEYFGEATDYKKILRLFSEKFNAVTSAGSNINAGGGNLDNLNCEFQLSLEDMKSETSM